MKSVCIVVSGLCPNTRHYYTNFDSILLLGDSIMCWWRNILDYFEKSGFLWDHRCFQLNSGPVFQMTHVGNTVCCSSPHLLTYLVTPWSTDLLEKLIGSHLVKKFPTFMETEGSLPDSQEPVPIPGQINPVHTPTFHFLKIQVNIIIPSTPGFSRWSLSHQVSPPQLCTHLSSHPHVLHAQPISFFSNWSPEKYCVSSTDH